MAYLPEVFIGPLRIDATPATVEVLIADVVEWPEDIETTQAGVRFFHGAHDA